MAILVDEAIWQWRGRRWAHLISDADFGELHTFAEQLGIRRIGFQGDHYDVETRTRERAISLGAEPIPSRVLVRRLRDAGLRYRGAASWEASELQMFSTLSDVIAGAHRFFVGHPDLPELAGKVGQHEDIVLGAPCRMLRRPFEVAIVVETLAGPFDIVADGRHRSVD